MPAAALAPTSRLVVFTPLPPLENGIADYAAELLPRLASARATTVVIDDHVPQPQVPTGCELIRLAEYVARADEFARDDHLYQVGNNPDHIYLIPWLLRRPGIVVLHDVSLHHLMDQATLRHGDLAGYSAVLELEYGAAGRLLAEQFEQHRWRTRSMFFELPLTRELLARARAVIVHSLYAATKVGAQQADLPVELVRHHVALPALRAGTDGARERAREALEVADDTVLLVSLGFVTRAKQIDVTLRFLANHRASLPPMRYIIAGQDSPEDFDVRALITSLGLEDIVEITGYVAEPDFYRYVAASDIVVNLRYPSGGETSGTLIRALGAGACLVVNDIGSFAEYPDDVCAKVPVDSGVDDADFERVVLPLIRSSAARRRLSRAARRYMQATHAIEESARRYLRILQQHGRRPVPPLVEFTGRALLTPAHRERLLGTLPPHAREHLPLWAAEGMMPCGDGGEVLLVEAPAPHRALLVDIFGHADGRIAALPLDRLVVAPLAAVQRRRFSLAVLDLQFRESRARLSDALLALNARLNHQGSLVLTLADAASTLPADTLIRTRHVLEACGYVVEHALRSRESLSFVLDAASSGAGAASDALVVRARKVSEFVSPRAASAWDAAAAQVA